MIGSLSRYQLWRPGRAERGCRNGERRKGEGKIKAQSRKASYVIVCTSFFRETLGWLAWNGEVAGRKAQLFQGFALSRFFLPGSAASQLVRPT